MLTSITTLGTIAAINIVPTINIESLPAPTVDSKNILLSQHSLQEYRGALDSMNPFSNIQEYSIPQEDNNSSYKIKILGAKNGHPVVSFYAVEPYRYWTYEIMDFNESNYNETTWHSRFQNLMYRIDDSMRSHPGPIEEPPLLYFPKKSLDFEVINDVSFRSGWGVTNSDIGHYTIKKQLSYNVVSDYIKTMYTAKNPDKSIVFPMLKIKKVGIVIAANVISPPISDSYAEALVTIGNPPKTQAEQNHLRVILPKGSDSGEEWWKGFLQGATVVLAAGTLGAGLFGLGASAATAAGETLVELGATELGEAIVGEFATTETVSSATEAMMLGLQSSLYTRLSLPALMSSIGAAIIFKTTQSNSAYAKIMGNANLINIDWGDLNYPGNNINFDTTINLQLYGSGHSSSLFTQVSKETIGDIGLTYEFEPVGYQYTFREI